MKTIDPENMTLNEMLKILGFDTAPDTNGRKTILKDGEIVGRFTAHECTAYLRTTYPQHFREAP